MDANADFAWMDDTDLSGEISSTADTLQGSDIANTSISSGGDWLSNVWSAIGSPTARNLLNLGSGIYGLTQAQKMKQLASGAYKASDPFGSQRPIYAAQLAALMKDPSSLKNDPAYQFQLNAGSDAVERSMAARGFLGSGNEAIALTEYGQKFGSQYLDQRMKFLAELSGAGISPNFGASLSGYASGIDTASAALASLGYGSTMAGQPSPNTPGSGYHPKTAGGEAAAIGGLATTAGKVISGLGGTTTGSAVSDLGGLVSGAAKGGVGGYAQAAGSAAKLGQLASGGSVASRVGATGPDPSGIGYVTPTAGTGGLNIDKGVGVVGDLASIYTGVQQGDAGGYAKAVSGAADLAGYNVPYLGYVDAASKLAKGDTGSAGYSAAITAAGPIAAIGAAIADWANAPGKKDQARMGVTSDILTSQLGFKKASGVGGAKFNIYEGPDGKFYQLSGSDFKTFSRIITSGASGDELTSALNSFLSSAYRPNYKGH